MTNRGNPPRRVIVTGGGKGIGRAIVERFAAGGAAVAFCGREERALDQLRDELTARGVTAYAKPVDVSDEEAVEAFVAGAEAALGGIDTLVNNAALTYASGVVAARITDLSTAEWRRTLGVNLDGVFFTTRAVARRMREAGNGGAIVNISSVHAHMPNATTPHYDAAKAAIEGLTRNLALALGPDGIRVNGVAPGPIHFTGAGGDTPPLDEATVRKFEEYTILRRFGDPEEIAAAVAFLASPEASYITGQTLVVDGGFLIRHAAMGT